MTAFLSLDNNLMRKAHFYLEAIHPEPGRLRMDHF